MAYAETSRSCDARLNTSGNSHAYNLQIIHRSVDDWQSPGRLAKALLKRPLPQQMGAGQRIGLEQTGEIAFIDNLASFAPGIWSQIDDVIGPLNHLRIVLYYHDRVPFVAQFFQEFVQTMDIARVKSDAWLVKDVHDIDQAAVKMLDHFDPLRFTSRQCLGGSIQAEILQANLHQMLQPLGQCANDWRRRRFCDTLDYL